MLRLSRASYTAPPPPAAAAAGLAVGAGGGGGWLAPAAERGARDGPLPLEEAEEGCDDNLEIHAHVPDASLSADPEMLVDFKLEATREMLVRAARALRSLLRWAPPHQCCHCPRALCRGS